MGKRIISQARGKGGPTYTAPSFKYKGSVKHRIRAEEEVSGIVIDLITCRGHSAPLAVIQYEDTEMSLMLAPEGIKVGDTVATGTQQSEIGNTLKLEDIPDGTMIYNIESCPGDGGKFCRAGGTFAKVVSRNKENVSVELPSKKTRVFNSLCRANIGVIAGSGRSEKPLLKAGNAFHKMKAKNKLYPKVSGSAMNAVDHPFGNARTSRKARSKPISKHAPPGRKVGMVGARRSGRRKK